MERLDPLLGVLPMHTLPEEWDALLTRLQVFQEDPLYPALKEYMPELIRSVEERVIPEVKRSSQAAHRYWNDLKWTAEMNTSSRTCLARSYVDWIFIMFMKRRAA